MKSFFENKTIVVTGASSGIGKSLVEILSSFNTNLVLCARSEDKMKALVNHLNIAPEKYLIIPIDFSEKPDFNLVVQKIVDKFSKIDILINNAGIAQKSLVQETSEVVERKIMEVNYFATINFTKAVLPHFIKNRSGNIVAISSILGEIGLPFVAPYCASKHAINGYYNSLRYDVEQHNILVSIIAPGFIKTDITKKALLGNGEIYHKDSVAQKEGMDVEKCAMRILKQIKKQNRFSYVGGLETFMPKVAFFFPRVFHSLMKKMHKI